MYKTFTLSIFTALISGLFLITSCSSSDDGGATTASVPANAIIIDSTNAETTVAASVTTVDSLDFVLSVETAPTMGLLDALALVEPRIDSIKNTLSNSGADAVYGVTVSESGNCTVSGTFSFTGDEGGTYPNFTDSGTVTLVDCDEGFDFIMNGTISWVESGNYETGDFSDSTTGSLSMESTDPNNALKFSFTGMNFAETGNNIAGTYIITKATYTIDFVIDGVSGNGFFVNLTADIVESIGGESSCPESGHITITGGNNTTAEGIYNGDGTMTIKANGEIVRTDATCYR